MVWVALDFESTIQSSIRMVDGNLWLSASFSPIYFLASGDLDIRLREERSVDLVDG